MALENIPVSELELSVRTANCLRNSAYTNLGQLFEAFSRDNGKELLELPHFGRKSYNELREVVRYLQPKNEAIEWATAHVREVRAIMAGNAVIVPTFALIRELYGHDPR